MREKYYFEKWYNQIQSEILEHIDFRNGVIQENVQNKECIIDVAYQNAIHFVAILSEYRFMLTYFITRNGSTIGNLHSTWGEDIIKNRYIVRIQKFVNEISDGKYDNKKSNAEKLQEIIRNRNLVSYMNNTKWKEFLRAMTEEMPFEPPYDYKTVWEEPHELSFGTGYDCESFNFYDFKTIEWVKVRPEFEEHRWKGALVEDEVVCHDMTEDFLGLMKKYAIPYMYDETENVYIIYGYR